MACDVTIEFVKKDPKGNEKKIKTSIELSDSPMESIAQVLSQDTEVLEDLISKLNKLYREKDIKRKNQIGNISYEKLINTIPISGGWPLSSTVKSFNASDYNILYVDMNSSSKTVEKPKTIKVGEGKTIQLITVYRNQLYNFRNWIIANDLVDSIDDNTELSEEFKAVVEELKTDKKKILTDFLNEGYKGKDTIKYKDKVLYVPSILESQIFSLQEQIQNRKYNNEFFNALAYNFNQQNKNQGSKEVTIKTKDFQALAKKLLPKELYDAISKIESVKEQVSTILSELRQTDPDFQYKLQSASDNIIKFQRVFLTINERYGLGFEDTQKNFEYLESYKGFDIYSYNGKYYQTHDALTDLDTLEAYVSKEDAKRKIDYIVNKTIIGNTHVGLKRKGQDKKVRYLQSKEGYSFGRIIKSLDVQFSTKELTDREGSLMNKGTLKDFHDYIDQGAFYPTMKQRIHEVIDTPEKAAAFIYMYKESRDKGQLAVGYILNTISNAGYKYYYVAHGESSNALRVVEITEDSAKNIKQHEITELKHFDFPKAEVIWNLCKAIEKRIDGTGMEVKLLTQEEISQQFPLADSTAKSFISGNYIVINSTTTEITDPLHEYAHIFLGLIKAQNYNKYLDLMNQVLSRENQESLRKRIRNKKDLYKNKSEFDIHEEVFADIFAKFILNNNYSQFISDSQIRKEVEKESEIIWNMLDRRDKILSMGDIWNYPIASLTNFNSDMIINLQEEESPMERFKIHRQASNWIQRQIEEKNIKEVCK